MHKKKRRHVVVDLKMLKELISGCMADYLNDNNVFIYKSENVSTYF